MKPLTARQRKLRVMAECDVIKPDRRHSLGFEYISIQNLSNHLRKLCAKHGLDIAMTFPQGDDGYIDISLVNADDEEDAIWSRWPVVDGDKAWAYTFKYALVRLFVIGDAEEADEAEMAEKSGNPLRGVPEPPSAIERGFPGSTPPAPPRTSPYIGTPKQRPPRGPWHETMLAPREAA